MAINEIEILSTSLSLKCWKAKAEEIPILHDKICKEADGFDIESETQGFHDCETDGMLIRGYFSAIVPFEVEHLEDGITTKTLMKRIETCEFTITPEVIFTTGKTAPQMALIHVLTKLTGYGIALMEFEFHDLSRFNDRLTQVKSIVLSNPKNMEVRRARLAGQIESYMEYNVIDPKNHGIESVSGLADTPLGPLTITVGRKGSLRFGVKRGFIMTIECILWILKLVCEDKPPLPGI